MVNSVQEEMQHEKDRSIREELVNMEQEPVQRILEDCPYDISYEEAHERLDECVQWDA
jgi:hypothetical protein